MWSFVERYSSLMVAIASGMLLGRLLTPAQFGVFSLCATVMVVAGILRDFGVSEYLNQEKDLTEDKIRAAFGIAIVLAWSIGLVIVCIRHAAAAYYREPLVADLLLVLSINFLILPFGSPAFALMSREMAFRKIFVVQIVSNIVQSVVSVILALRGYGAMSLAIAPVCSIAVQTMLVTYFRPRDSMLMPSFKAARHVLSYGSMFVTSRFIETFTRNAHEFVLAKQVDFASVGLFSRAFSLIELFNNNVTSAVMRVATPSFASDHRAGNPLHAIFARGTAIFTCVAFTFLGFLSLMAPDLIRVMFGDQWGRAGHLAQILAVALLPSYLVVLAPQLLAATGHVKRRLQISLWFSPVHLAGVLIASFISLEAVAMVWGVSNTVMLGMYVFHLKKVLNSSARELFLPSLASVAVAAISVSAMAAALYLCHRLQLPSLLNLVVVGAVAAAAWFGAISVTRHPVHAEIMRFVQLRRQRPSTP